MIKMYGILELEMPKFIVTHIRPDLDACTSVWLVKRYFQGFAKACVIFVPAGSTYKSMPADTDKNIIHVDTGCGLFDHHQIKARLSAAKRIIDYLIDKNKLSFYEKHALSRLSETVTALDNFEDCMFPNAEGDFYDLGLHKLLEGVNYNEENDNVVMEFGCRAAEAFYTILLHKVRAEHDIGNGIKFKVGDYKAIGLFTRNEEAMTLAQKQGFQIVIRKDPKTNRARIKARPDADISFRNVYKELEVKDKTGYWFLHSSEKMLLNGSSKNPKTIPTNLSLDYLIKLVKEHTLHNKKI